MKIVVLGARGMLGSELAESFDDDVRGFDKSELDITKDAELSKLEQIKPDIIINAAAYTDVDRAENDKKRAFSVNTYAVEKIAEMCAKIGCILIQYSTDFVFDGEDGEYDEESEKNPINVYGASKSLAEDLIILKTEKYYIIRTSWLFGKNGKNFVDSIVKAGSEKESINVVEDQVGCPTSAKDLVQATKSIIGRPFGVYHLTNSGYCSWFEFASEIVKIKDLNTTVHPITSTAYPQIAARPKKVVLKNTKTEILRHWKDALKEYLG